MKRRHKNLGQTTLVLALLGAAFGWNLLSQPVNARFTADATTSVDQGLRSPDEIVCLRAEWTLEDEGRTIRAQVSRGQQGEVVIDLADFFLGNGLILASSERTRVRAADSYEPVVLRLTQDNRSIVISPESSWGRIHRDSGLGLEYEIVD